MENKIKIKVNIADRIYPLTIRPEQEEVIRLSVKKIDQMIKQLEQSYAVRDKQDVLAMCSLQYATKLIQKDNSEDDRNKILSCCINRILYLDSLSIDFEIYNE